MQPVVSFICLASLWCVAYVSGVHVCMVYVSSLCVLYMHVECSVYIFNITHS